MHGKSLVSLRSTIPSNTNELIFDKKYFNGKYIHVKNLTHAKLVQ